MSFVCIELVVYVKNVAPDMYSYFINTYLTTKIRPHLQNVVHVHYYNVVHVN